MNHEKVKLHATRYIHPRMLYATAYPYAAKFESIWDKVGRVLYNFLTCESVRDHLFLWKHNDSVRISGKP